MTMVGHKEDTACPLCLSRQGEGVVGLSPFPHVHNCAYSADTSNPCSGLFLQQQNKAVFGKEDPWAGADGIHWCRPGRSLPGPAAAVEPRVTPAQL